MKTLFAFFALALAGRADIIGFEDWQHPLSDRDFNDAEYTTTGLDFHRHAPFSFTAPPGYHETPFPGPAEYFDYATVAQDVSTIVFLSGETSGHDLLQVSLNGSWWITVHNGITMYVDPGERVDFRLDTGGNLLYSDPARNIDGLGYGVVQDALPPPNDPVPSVPEPGSLVLAATGVVIIFAARRKR